MISGTVTDGHPTVIVMFRIPNRSDVPIEFVVDTGFTDDCIDDYHYLFNPIAVLPQQIKRQSRPQLVRH